MLLYGFRSCDTVRAAMHWLDAEGIGYTFIDYRRTPLDPATIDDWFARTDWEAVFNRNATSFRKLSAEEQGAVDMASAKRLILADTNFIKRPVLDTGAMILTGFNAERWSDANLR